MTKEEALKKIEESEEFVVGMNSKVDLDDVEVTLLSVEEAKALPGDILAFPDWWWLSSPVKNPGKAAYVEYGNSVDCENGYFIINKYNCVRPALKIYNLDSLNLVVGQKVLFWTIFGITLETTLCLQNHLIWANIRSTLGLTGETFGINTLSKIQMCTRFFEVGYRRGSNCLN